MGQYRVITDLGNFIILLNPVKTEVVLDQQTDKPMMVVMNIYPMMITGVTTELITLLLLPTIRHDRAERITAARMHSHARRRMTVIGCISYGKTGRACNAVAVAETP